MLPLKALEVAGAFIDQHGAQPLITECLIYALPNSRGLRASAYSAAEPATSGNDVSFEQTTGTPHAIASSTVKPKPS